jgi:hypothetical protein
VSSRRSLAYARKPSGFRFAPRDRTRVAVVKLPLNLVWLSFGGRSLALGYAVVALVM